MAGKKHQTVIARNEKGQITKTNGRRPRHSPEDLAILTKRIADIVRTGNYLTRSAIAAGMSESTFWYYYKAGKAGNTKYITFYEEITKAEAEAEIVAVAMVRKAMPDNWVAAMTFLERKFPDRWARRESLHVEGGVDVTHTAKQPVVTIHVSQESRKVSDEINSQPVVDAEVIEEKHYTR